MGLRPMGLQTDYSWPFFFPPEVCCWYIFLCVYRITSSLVLCHQVIVAAVLKTTEYTGMLYSCIYPTPLPSERNSGFLSDEHRCYHLQEVSADP